jgi:hypothetical protein
MIRRSPSTQGQLAIGVAIAFIGVVSMFAFVFSISMNVREKMALQQTSDYASLAASVSQWKALDEIKQMNQHIEKLWFTALATQQFDHCDTGPYGLAGPMKAAGYFYYTGLAGINAKLASLQISDPTLTSIDPEDTSAGAGLCATACQKYNDAINKKIRSDYDKARSTLAQYIVHLIMNTNDRAFRMALRQFLVPSQLPWNLQQKLEQELGAGFTFQNVLSLYDQGRFNFAQNNHEWGYEIVSENAQDPLFLPTDEIRPFILPTYHWQDRPDPSTYQYKCQNTFFPSYAPPRSKSSRAKIIKTGDFQTHFFTGVNYLPPKHAFEENEALKKKQINPDNFGRDEDRGDDVYFFQRKSAVGVRSAAKPFGGTFPSGLSAPSLGFIQQLLDGDFEPPSQYSASAGKEFTGAKLFGIADSDEIGGYHLFRAEIEANQQDAQGNTRNVWRIFKEDFLH